MPRLYACAALLALLAGAVSAYAYTPVSADVRSELPEWGVAAASHRKLHAAAVGVPRSLPVELTSIDSRPINMGDAVACLALQRAERARARHLAACALRLLVACRV